MELSRYNLVKIHKEKLLSLYEQQLLLRKITLFCDI